MANGIASLGRANRAGHGEAVAFGVQVQLVLEQRLGAQPLRARQDLSQVRAFCKSVGLPTSLADLALADITGAELSELARVALDPAGNMGNMPFAVTAEDLIGAVKALAQPV